MTCLRIVHRTCYTYAQPVAFGQHRLVLRPREGHDLRVESMLLQITPRHRLVWTRDVFGNSVAIVDFLESAAMLEIISNVVVQRSNPFPDQEPHEPWRVRFPVQYEPLEAPLISAYQALSYPDDLEYVRAWRQDAVGQAAQDDAEAVLFALGTQIYRQIKYRRRSEKGVQTPAETLRLGSGSCRDMATLMMEAGRGLGLATRFASGYLDCPASEAGRASTHAWLEVYLPALGWRGFDPTIGQPTSLKHVVTGVSNHPRGVMPISGTFSGWTGDYRGDMDVQVKIEKLDCDTTRPHIHKQLTYGSQTF